MSRRFWLPPWSGRRRCWRWRPPRWRGGRRGRAPPPPPPGLEAALHRLEAALPAEALSRVEACAAQLGTAAPALSRLPEVLAALLAQQSGLARGEARLGDAARYLTDTTDRLAGEAALLESQAVRLQAMISILGREGRLSG
ncbi:hypothetical protein [Teichococcus aerofrigidensis]